MRHARTAILSAAATCLLALATPAIAQVSSFELGHPTGCAQCGGAYSTVIPQNYDFGGVPVIGPVLGVPSAAVALSPEMRPAATSKMRHAKHRFTAAPVEVR